jgi:hypothetical protein
MRTTVTAVPGVARSPSSIAASPNGPNLPTRTPQPRTLFRPVTMRVLGQTLKATGAASAPRRPGALRGVQHRRGPRSRRPRHRRQPPPIRRHSTKPRQPSNGGRKGPPSPRRSHGSTRHRRSPPRCLRPRARLTAARRGKSPQPRSPPSPQPLRVASCA